MTDDSAAVRPREVLVLCGSVRADGYTGALARHAADCLRQQGFRSTVWELGTRPLPIADPAHHHDPAANPDPSVQEFVAAAQRAEAFVLAGPVYHNSYSGVLKNALDCLSIAEFDGKPVGLLAHGPKLTAVQACDHLRIVVRGLYGLCVPEQAVTTPADYERDAHGALRLAEPGMRARVNGLVASVVKAARR
ncbi:NADPH-dependent FMN reductase [Kitasatospora saccharophila]|uniref:NADPH-dependent FMN reductase n=1 Tax=Kitasatospora saccharophila TaxID=407973 RepID=UPI0031D403E8